MAKIYTKFDGRILKVESEGLKLEVDTSGNLSVDVFTKNSEYVNVSGIWEDVAGFIDKVFERGFKVQGVTVRNDVRVVMNAGPFELVTYGDDYISLDLREGEYHFGLALTKSNASIICLEVKGYETTYTKSYSEAGDFSDIAADILMKYRVVASAKRAGIEVEGDRLYVVTEGEDYAISFMPKWWNMRFVACFGKGFEGEKFYEWALNVVKMYKNTIKYKKEKFDRYRFRVGYFEIVYQIDGYLTIRYADGVRVDYYDGVVVVQGEGIKAEFKADKEMVASYKMEIASALDRVIKNRGKAL